MTDAGRGNSGDRTRSRLGFKPIGKALPTNSSAWRNRHSRSREKFLSVTFTKRVNRANPKAPCKKPGAARIHSPTESLTQGAPLPLHPKTKKITHITRNRKNKTLAIPAEAAAIPPNPNTAATSAIIRKVTAQPNISSPPLV